MRAYIIPAAKIVTVHETRLPATYHLNRENGPKVREYPEGSPYIELTDRQGETGVIPGEIDDVVDVYSLNVSHYGGGARTSRELGLYRLGSATATVERNEHGYHFIKVRGRKAAEVIALGERIVAGTIAPAQTYEREQVRDHTPGFREALRRLIEAAFNHLDRPIFA